MPSSFPRSPQLTKGALVGVTIPFLQPVFNVIPFQYNPQTFTRNFSIWHTGSGAGSSSEEGTAKGSQPEDPRESFNLSIELDATDELEEPEKFPRTVVSGVADRLAALELLLYPVVDLVDDIFNLGLNQCAEVPIALFVWGPGRILPVRITSFSVEEQAFSPTLYPIRATVTLGVQVLIAEDFLKRGLELDPAAELAARSYKYIRALMRNSARANRSNADSLLGMLPF